jgi:hypothetical protein
VGGGKREDTSHHIHMLESFCQTIYKVDVGEMVESSNQSCGQLKRKTPQNISNNLLKIKNTVNFM